MFFLDSHESLGGNPGVWRRKVYGTGNRGAGLLVVEG